MQKDAFISDDQQYRYWLSRVWDNSKIPLTYIMLNPSTADADLDDPTIRRCMSFAQRDGFGGILVLNLYAFRSTDPEQLIYVKDPIGSENVHFVELALRNHATRLSGIPLICAWGTKGVTFEAFKKRFYVPPNVNFQCLGVTKGGYPKHPLYIPNSQPFVQFGDGTWTSD